MMIREFTDEIVWEVWVKAYMVTVFDGPLWRKDEYGAWIKRTDYENRNSQYGWVIEHIIPISQGGTNDISNLRPLQWENAERVTNSGLQPSITSLGTENVRRESQ